MSELHLVKQKLQERCAVKQPAVLQLLLSNKMWTLVVKVVFLALIAGQEDTAALQDVTHDLFGSENRGTVAAFGDFDADKQSDMFIIREGERTV